MIRLNRQEVLANGELRALDGISIRLIRGTGQSHCCKVDSTQLNALSRRIGIKVIQQNSARSSYYRESCSFDG